MTSTKYLVQNCSIEVALLSDGPTEAKILYGNGMKTPKMMKAFCRNLLRTRIYH